MRAPPAALDWVNQPNPFRRYEGAPLTQFPILVADEEPLSPRYEDIYRRGSVPSAPLTIRSLSRLFEYALALSAWKQAGGTRWALRSNPSSGNLHPTEGYLLIGALPELSHAPGVYHYAPGEHGLERRADGSAEWFTQLMREFPPQAFLVGLSSIHWREAWKYGERAFRYCQHDAGHAIGTLRIAAATLGWSAVVLHGLADETIEALLGLNRAEDFAGAEREQPELVMLVWPNDSAGPWCAGAQRALPLGLDPLLARELTTQDWRGTANRLSRDDPDRLDRHRRGGARLTSSDRRAVRLGPVRHACPGASKRSIPRRAAGRPHHPPAAQPPGLRWPDLDHGRALPRHARARHAARGTGGEPAADALGCHCLGAAHPPGLVRSSGGRTRARAVRTCPRPGQAGQAEARHASALRLVRASRVPGGPSPSQAGKRRCEAACDASELLSGHRGRWGLFARHDRRVSRRLVHARALVLSPALLGRRA